MTTTNNIQPAPNTLDPNTPPPRAKVLCIDDDPHVSHGMQLWLNQFEVEVLHAHYGMQGVALAVSEQPDAIITDIRMPQGEGDHVVACLKRQAQTRDIPIIVLTGQKDADLELRMRQMGVQQYLKKPVTWSELEETLFEVLKLPKIDDAHERIRPHLSRR